MVWYYRSGDANGLTTEHTEDEKESIEISKSMSM
jgi:hypothetical protein